MPSATQVRTMFRSAARHLTEPHPFARNPVSMRAHAWRAGDLSKRVIKTSTVYFPFYAAILGWPVAAAWWFNGNM
ncbi:Nn.00g085970.m01.CDS01 [Neocucurbitaria sp. VM-36]